MTKKPIIIDTDPGIDDAVALGIALFDESLDVKLITTVAGNVDVEKTTKNALKLLEFWGKDIPVAKGSSSPLIRPLDNAASVHGNTGLDGFDFDEPKIKPIEKNAVDAMRVTIMSSSVPITLVAIAPLTNIALLLSLYPEVKKNIEEIVIMGGSASRGNKTPMAEFNVAIDPEAAKIVFKSGVKIIMCGLDVGREALIFPEDVDELKKMNRTGKMVFSLFQHYRGGSLKTGLKMYDSCAIAYLLNSELYTAQECFVDVETAGELTSGCTVVDLRGYFKKLANAKVCLEIDTNNFRKWFLNALRKTI